MFPDFVYAVACGRYHGQVCQSIVELGNVPADLTTKIINSRPEQGLLGDRETSAVTEFKPLILDR